MAFSRDDAPTRDDLPPAHRRRESGTGTQETRAIQSGSSTESISRSTGISAATTAITPSEALHAAEVQRARAIIRVGWALSAVTIGALPLFSGSPTLEAAMLVGLLVGMVVSFFYHQYIRDSARYTPRGMFMLSLLTMVNAQIAVVYFGVFSACPIIVVLGVYFFARSEGRGVTVAVYAVAASTQALAATLILSGAIRDPGLFPHPDIPMHELVLAQLFIQIVYFATYLIGQQARNSTLRAVSDMHRAMQQVAQRDALLAEARQDLDRALEVGGPGRYSERTMGSYKLGIVIGRGAMGEIYEATHVNTGQIAAVKLLHVNLLADPRQVTRFLREVRAASALASPNVVRVLEASDPLDPIPYLAMERLHGHDLAHHLRQHRELSGRKVCEMARQVGSVLDAARDQGIVHRDIKPQNLFLAEQPRGEPLWKVLDFGVATLAEHTGTLTQGHIVGTPAYMSPEQARGETVDHRTDLYALAAVGYRCVTCRPPFSGKDTPGLLYRVVHSMPERPSALAKVPADIDHVLAIGLAKRREDRFDSGRALADALVAAYAGELDPELRRRGAALIERQPWGATG